MKSKANAIGEFYADCVLTFLKALVGYLIVAVTLGIVAGVVVIIVSAIGSLGH